MLILFHFLQISLKFPKYFKGIADNAVKSNKDVGYKEDKSMTVEEARQAYSTQLKSYNIQKCKLAQHREEADGQEAFADGPELVNVEDTMASATSIAEGMVTE